jgi:hypothetical protein
MYCIYSEVPEYILVYSLNDSLDTNKICLICWETSEVGEPVKQIKEFATFGSMCECNAKFHASCFNVWINNTSSCPICRIKIHDNLTVVNNTYYILNNPNYIRCKILIISLCNYAISTIKIIIWINMINIITMSLFKLYSIYNYDIQYLDTVIFNSTFII